MTSTPSRRRPQFSNSITTIAVACFCPSLLRRFWDSVAFGDGCWEWKFRTDRCGYGRMKIDNKSRLAHRLAFELFNGPVTDGLWVLHTCDNRRCVRPHHLYLGTHEQNMRDMHNRGRGVSRRGEDNGASKLTGEQVRDIRARYKTGGMSQKRLAAEYGVALSLINAIVHRRIWRWLPEAAA